MDDDKVQGKDGEGCSERKKAAKTKKGKADETEGKPPAVAAAVVCCADDTSEGGDNNNDNDHNDEDSVERDTQKNGDG